VEAERGRRAPGAADEAVGRLDAGDAAERRRAADRAAGIGADAAENETSRDPGAGAAAAAGGEMVGVPGVARRRLREVEARTAIGEFMRRRLADQRRAGGVQLLGAGGVSVGDVVLQDLRLAGRRDALGVDDVLEADLDAVQRS